MSANKKELFQSFISKAKTDLGLKKTRPITGFDASFEGNYGEFDVMLSVEEYMDRNDPSTVVQMTWQAGNQGVSFEDDFLDHHEGKLRFSVYRLTFDPAGMYQEDRTAIGSRVVYGGNFQNTVKKMHRLVTRELNLNKNTMKISERKLKKIIREETKKVMNEEINYEEIGRFATAGGDYSVEIKRGNLPGEDSVVLKNMRGEVLVNVKGRDLDRLMNLLNSAKRGL
jgi:hypothetical protein